MDSRMKKLSLACAAGLTALAFNGGTAQAAVYTLASSDANGATTSFNGSGNWSPTGGGAPSTGNTYQNNSALTILRTPWTTQNYSFGGDSLTLNSGLLFYKGYSDATYSTDASSTITINNLILDNGGGVSHDSNQGNSALITANLAGNIQVNAGGGVFRSQSFIKRALNVTANISGVGGLTITAGSGFNPDLRVTLAGTNTYAGGTKISTVTGQAAGTILTLIAGAGSSFGTGDVTLTAPPTNVTYKLELDGASNIASGARLILPTGLPAGSVNLNYLGTDNIADISFDGGTTWQNTGTFGAGGTNPGGVFTGGGLIAVPEPAGLALLGLSGLAMLRRQRKA